MKEILFVDPTYIKANGRPKLNAPYEVKLNNFINKANAKYDYKFDYSKVIWVGPHTEVTIVCPIHGDFQQKPDNHMCSTNGCPKCGKDKLNHHPWKLTEDDYIKQASEIHENYYSYPNLNYKSLNDQINVVCPVHGEYSMHARAHLSGGGKCSKCVRRSSGFYSHGYFNNHPETIVSGKLYFVKLYNANEEFFKIGITKHGAYHRFYVDEKIPYEMEIIKEVEMPLYEAYCREQELLEKYKDHYFHPSMDFPGRTECLNMDIRDEI